MADVGELLAEGETKRIYALAGDAGRVVIQSKDRITAGDGVRAHDLLGKAEISNSTTSKIFRLLDSAGIRTHFIDSRDATSFVGRRCSMVPIEWVSRRIATGSFLKRNVGVKEGFRFMPTKLETFFKDDANNDPIYSDEQILATKFQVGGKCIGQLELDVMKQTTRAVFEILEKIWASLDCVLVDMKIEFGVDTQSGDLLVADVIDSDSWRLWPSGDSRLMKDKQVYRNLKTVTNDDLDQVKRNFQWVADRLDHIDTSVVHGQVVILMGSPSDEPFGRQIHKHCTDLGVACSMRITSAHKGADETLKIIADYEASSIPTVIVAVAGRSNGLGPVSSGSCSLPVINCPPVTWQTASQDLWSSVNVPSGLGCCTVIYPEAAALCAAQILALNDCLLFAKLRAKRCNTWIKLRMADAAIQLQLAATTTTAS